MSEEAQGIKKSTYILLLAGIVLCVIVFLTPAPANFTDEGWRVLGLLIPTILVWATEAMPVGVASVWFLALVSIFKLVPATQAFSGFTNHLTWLMVGAFALSVAMEQTNLSKRLSYYLLSKAKGYWGIIVASYLANILMLAIPSSAARSGILAPILSSIMDAVGRPMKSNFSRFLTYNFCMSTNLFVGILFLTGGAANGVMIGLYTQYAGNTLSWMQWFVVMFIPVVVISVIMFLGALLVGGRPEPELVLKLKDNTSLKEAYQALGPMTFDEKKVVAAFILAVVLWALGDVIDVRPGFSAIFIMGLLFLPGIGVLDGKKSLGKLNWTIILLIGAVMGLGSILSATKLSDTLSALLFDPIMTPFANLGLFGIALAVVIISFLVHFILPSPNNVTLMVPLLVTWGINYGLPPGAILAFLGLLALMNDKLVLLAYQMPPYYIFLGMDVTDVPRFNQLLIKMYPIAAIAMIIAAFAAYGMIMLTGFGAV